MAELRVQKVETTCLFELTWGSHQRLTAQIPFSGLLWNLYEDWQRLYLSFYNTQLRGRALGGGTGYAPPLDLQSRLGEAEARLLSEFHRWLRHPDLYDISRQLTQLANAATPAGEPSETLSISCAPLDLARLPWETWEVGQSLSTGLSISRTTTNLRHVPATRRGDRLRILVIIGDDTGLNFQREKTALQALFPTGTLQFVGWQQGKSIDALETEIKRAIANERGWDMLFFAGHSNETQSTGGELGIAPNTFMSIQDIAPQLAIARQNGLQFALFNSCKGLSLAESLIDMGFSQVAVMREPVHNQVAEEFLVQFLKHLAEYHDVQECLQFACNYLQVERTVTYPSAYLIPSLFRHPQTPLFRLQPPTWKRTLRKFLPRPYEALAIAILCLLSWQLPVQQWLLERRVLAQAVYRDWTQRAIPTEQPSVLLVQIDSNFLEGKMLRPVPRDYLAQVVDRLAGVPVLGIDYLLDIQTPEDEQLGQALDNAATMGSRIVLGSSLDRNSGDWRVANEAIARNGTHTLSGNMNVRGVHYIELLHADPLPLSFLLASLHRACLPTDIARSNVACQLKQPQNDAIAAVSDSPRFYPSLLTGLSYFLGQMWLHPIVDYSLSPQQVYATISAKDLLNSSQSLFLDETSQSVIIVPNYPEAGVDKAEQDNFLAPAAFQYWSDKPYSVLTGGEYHAYLFHHYLNHRFVSPLPDLWFVLLGGLLGKGVSLLGRDRLAFRTWGRWSLIAATALYTLLSFELYLSSIAILLPVVLPAIAFWVFVMPLYFTKKS